MFSKPVLILAAVLAAAPALAAGTPTRVACPDTLTIEETVRPVPGFEVHGLSSRHEFQDFAVVEVASGGAENELQPAEHGEPGGTPRLTWSWTGQAGAKAYIVCVYEGTDVELRKEFPAGRDCTFFVGEGEGSRKTEGILQCDRVEP